MIEIYIQQINEIVKDQRSRPISNIEYEVLKGILELKTYDEISLKTSYALGTVSDLGMNILRILSNHFCCRITKKNLLYFCKTYLSTNKV